MSQFRQDPVSNDWIIISTGRKSRPVDFKNAKPERTPSSKETCPFEDLEKSGNLPIFYAFPDEKNWEVAVIPNKYPAININELCANEGADGPYKVVEGVGRHELVITRDHDINFPAFSDDKLKRLFFTFRERFKYLENDPCSNYASLFQSYGPTAGGSLYHPHYQILALPIVPPDIRRSLEGSSKYYRETGDCVHCAILRYELQAGTRVIYEDDGVVAVAPFASRTPYEVRIFPKKHQSHFEESTDKTIFHTAKVAAKVLTAIKDTLGDPDYNFFLHTSPFHGKLEYSHYHWHMEIIPKLSLFGGFEWSTGVDINSVDPDDAAKLLREAIK